MFKNVDKVKRWFEGLYKKEDPWGYKSNPEDTKRKEIILNTLKDLDIHFKSALDIGCGEGWITKDLPADLIYGWDISDKAMNRLPQRVIPLKEITGKYDLVIATGVLYRQCGHKWILEKIKETAKHIVLTCNIKGQERNNLPNQIYEYEFPYRKYIERLAVYDLSSS